MKWQIDKKRKEPVYEQLYREIRGGIVSGTLSSGTKLPSKRLLAEELGISIITVEHSYALLADEGYILARPGSGFYVSFGGLTQPAKKPAPLTLMQAPPDAPPERPNRRT